jgi:hypothetical protein
MIIKIDGKLRNIFNVKILKCIRDNITIQFSPGSKQKKYFDYDELVAFYVEYLTKQKTTNLEKKNAILVSNRDKLLIRIKQRTIKQETKANKICQQNIEKNCLATPKIIDRLAKQKIAQLQKIAYDNN